jgi:hypothetical protein
MSTETQTNRQNPTEGATQREAERQRWSESERESKEDIRGHLERCSDGKMMSYRKT